MLLDGEAGKDGKIEASGAGAKGGTMIPLLHPRDLPVTNMHLHDLGTLARTAHVADGVRKDELRPGDRVLVTTRNSTYSIRMLAPDRYEVSGGWFASHGHGSMVLGINGCTFGGHAIHSGLLAARGLFLEFANRVVTTRIHRVDLIRREELQN